VSADKEADVADVEDTSDELTDEPGAVDEVESEAEAETAQPRGLLQRLLVPLVLAILLLASAGATTWVYFAQYRSDLETSDTVKGDVIRSASDGTVALLSYSPDTLDKDFATAKTHLTGDFLNYYTQFTAEIVTPAAKQKAVKTSAAVVRSAMAQLQATSAEVLLFINQTTTSKENPDGSFTASSVKVGLTKVGNDWLISAFDPV
jgi:Mce-associated membrane protein